MRLIYGLEWATSRLSLMSAALAAIAIIAIVLIILLEIALRTFFATSTFMSDELVSYLIAAIGFLPLGYTFMGAGLLRVNLLLENVKRYPRLVRLIEFVCVAITLAVIGLLCWFLFANVSRQYTRGYSSGTMSGIPQWIPTGMMLLGLVIFWLQVFVYGLGILFGRRLLDNDTFDETAIG